MLETHIARGTADEAAEVLERVVETHEDDNELVSMLARAYLEAEDPKGAEHATSLLMAQDASNYPQFLPVTRLYLKHGEVDETIRILSTIIERMLAGREERELLEIVNQVLDRNPDHVAAFANARSHSLVAARYGCVAIVARASRGSQLKLRSSWTKSVMR